MSLEFSVSVVSFGRSDDKVKESGMPVATYKCEDDILCGVNIPKDKKNLTDFEKKHLPVIECPAEIKKDETFEIRVRVGGIDGIQHPNEAGHFIEWIEVYGGDSFIGRCSYSGGASYPVALFKVKFSHIHGPLKVWTKCNLHGLWEGIKDIKIEG